MRICNFFILTIAFCFLSLSAMSQSALCSLHDYHGSAYSPTMVDNGLAFRQVTKICRLYRRKTIPVYMQYGIENAYAYSNSYGQEYIVYDPNFFNRVSNQYGSAASLGILAHEAGHIIVGVRVPGMIADWSDEARADYFAGYTLAKLGVSPRAIQNMMRIENFYPSYRHPDGYTRATIIEEGYIAGGGSSF